MVHSVSMKVKKTPNDRRKLFKIDKQIICNNCYKKRTKKYPSFDFEKAETNFDNKDFLICVCLVENPNMKKEDIRKLVGLDYESFKYRWERKLWLSGPNNIKRARKIIKKIKEKKNDG